SLGRPPGPRSPVSAQRSHHRSWCRLAPAALTVGRELLQQRREFPLHLDHPPSLVQVSLKTLHPPAQPHVLTIERIGLRPTGRLRQCLQRALVPLVTPRRDQ